MSIDHFLFIEKYKTCQSGTKRKKGERYEERDKHENRVEFCGTKPIIRYLTNIYTKRKITVHAPFFRPVTLETMMEEYRRDWSFVDELNNPKEKPYIELILPDHFAELHQQLHPQVDEYMRVEYELLRKARCKDVKKKYKKSKMKGAGKKGKKGAGKKKRKRAAVDITAARSIDSLIAELIENGILMDVPKKSFDDFIGDYNYLAYEKRNIDMK